MIDVCIPAVYLDGIYRYIKVVKIIISRTEINDSLIFNIYLCSIIVDIPVLYFDC